MKDLFDYIQEEMAGDGGFSTPMNTLGAGEPGPECLVSAPAGGIPKHATTRIFRRKKKRKNGRDFEMKPEP